MENLISGSWCERIDSGNSKFNGGTLTRSRNNFQRRRMQCAREDGFWNFSGELKRTGLECQAIRVAWKLSRSMQESTYVYVCVCVYRYVCFCVRWTIRQKFFLAVQFWQYTTYRDGGGLVDHDDVLVHVYHRDRLRGDRHLVSATHQSQPA